MQAVEAFRLDGAGKGVLLDEVPPPKSCDGNESGFTWINVSIAGDEGREWLHKSGLPSYARDALLAGETRPRCTVHDDTALLNLRGVNLNPGAEPEDMVSLRCYLSHRLAITVHKRPLSGLNDVIDEVRAGRGSVTPGDLVSKLVLRLADRAEPVVATLNERIDDLEDRAETRSHSGMRGDLADIRRVSIVLRRYMFPQRDALSTLEIEAFDWIDATDRSRLREATERMTRLGEELDAIRDRAQVVHDMIMDMRAEVMNRQMLVLSVVAALFLPLGLLTGLLGINVGGIPGANWSYGFWAVCLLLAVLCAVQISLFRWMGLMGNRGREKD